ncbi:unnamed protein product, partial [marine sediment metagenome]
PGLTQSMNTQYNNPSKTYSQKNKYDPDPLDVKIKELEDEIKQLQEENKKLNNEFSEYKKMHYDLPYNEDGFISTSKNINGIKDPATWRKLQVVSFESEFIEPIDDNVVDDEISNDSDDEIDDIELTIDI